MIHGFWRSGSVRSLIETHNAAVAAVIAAENPSPAPTANPVNPTPIPTEIPFSIWTRNNASEMERGNEAILSE